MKDSKYNFIYLLDIPGAEFNSAQCLLCTTATTDATTTTTTTTTTNHNNRGNVRMNVIVRRVRVIIVAVQPAISFSYSKCVFVALVIQHAPYFLSSDAKMSQINAEFTVKK